MLHLRRDRWPSGATVVVPRRAKPYSVSGALVRARCRVRVLVLGETAAHYIRPCQTETADGVSRIGSLRTVQSGR